LIRINGREMNLDGLRVKVERRRARGPLGEKEWPARSLKKELQRMPELDPRSYFGIQYRLLRALALHGARLEPPLLPAGGFLARLPGLGRLGMLAAKVRRRMVTAPNEGYVGQQEQFNSHLIAGLEAASRIYHELQWEGEGRMAPPPTRTDALEDLDEAAVEGLMEATRGCLALIGLPGVSCMERLLEKGRLEAGIDTDDRLVAEYQAAFLPARWERPEDLPDSLRLEGLGALVLMAADRLTCEELEGLLAGVTASGKEASGAGGAPLLVRVSREGWTCPPGFVRVPDQRGRPRWTAEFLSWMMERHGFKVEPRQMGNAFFLVGEPAEVGVAPSAGGSAGEEAAGGAREAGSMPESPRVSAGEEAEEAPEEVAGERGADGGGIGPGGGAEAPGPEGGGKG